MIKEEEASQLTPIFKPMTTSECIAVFSFQCLSIHSLLLILIFKQFNDICSNSLNSIYIILTWKPLLPYLVIII